MEEDEDEEVRSERIIHQPPTCIEFCPVNPTILVVGTYELQESEADSSSQGTPSQSRTGRIELYRVRKKGLSPDFGVSGWIDKYDFPDCALLDLHFCPRYPTFFAVCTSTSRLVLFRLENVGHGDEVGSIEPSIVKAGSVQMVEDEGVLATSFVWNPRPATYPGGCVSLALAVTFSTGDIKLLEVGLDIKAEPCGNDNIPILSQASINPAHTLEAWTAAFTKLSHTRDDEQILLTGGDDSVLALHSFRYNIQPARLEANQLFQDLKSHGAGVTAILSILDVSHVSPRTRAFVTGSYDENIRVFTIEALPPYKRKVVAELPLGGGVWRLRRLWETLGQEAESGITCSVLILASCMHAGVRIVRIVRKQTGQQDENRCIWETEVVGQYTKGHDSMCYGADSVHVRRLVAGSVQGDKCTGKASWPHRSIDREDNYDLSQDFVVVSTSFYDKKICVWTYSMGG